jgi:transposase-like protein
MCGDRDRSGGRKPGERRSNTSEVERSFKKLLSRKDAARKLGIHPETLRLWARQGKGPQRRQRT